MPTKEEAHSQIAALVERFAEQLPSYKKSDYNETLTRRDFEDRSNIYMYNSTKFY